MLLLIVLAIISIASIGLAFNYWKHKDFWDKFEKIKGDRALPFIGHGLKYIGNDVPILEMLEQTYHDLGRTTFRVQVGRACYVVLTEPETCEVLLGSTKELYKLGDYSFLWDWLGEGLFLSNGNNGRIIRKSITPMLHFKTLENFITTFHEKEEVLIKIMKKRKNELIDVQHLMNAYALDLMCETVMGIVLNALEKSADSEFFCAIHSESELFKNRLSSFWKKIDFLYHFTNDYKQHLKNIHILNDTADRIIADGRKVFMEKHKSSQEDKDLSNDDVKRSETMTFLDMLFTIKNPNKTPLSDLRVRMEVNSLMFGGHETTTSALAFTLYMLAKHPEIQERAFKEQRELLGDNLSINPTFEEIEDMKYLERIIKETMRIYPPAPVYSRILQKDMTLPDGTVIPAGCQVAIAPYLMSRNPAYYPDPLKFDPDRFLPENIQNKHPYSYLIFSAGSRNCVGQRFAMIAMKSVLSKILRYFEILPGGPGTELKFTLDILLKSKNGVNLTVKEREYPL